MKLIAEPPGLGRQPCIFITQSHLVHNAVIELREIVVELRVLGISGIIEILELLIFCVEPLVFCRKLLVLGFGSLCGNVAFRGS